MLYQQLVGRNARCQPERPALSDASRRLTYAELDRRTGRLAAMLHDRGFQPGDRLGIHLLNCIEYLELIYTCARTGIVAVPLNTRYAAAELDEVLEDCRPKGLIRHAALPAPSQHVPWIHVIDDMPLEESDSASPEIFYGPDETFGLFYTSGTTGRAKGVMLTHANLLCNAHHCAYTEANKGLANYLHVAPMFHIADFTGTIVAALRGGHQTAVPRFEPGQLFEAIQRDRVTGTIMVPTMINAMTLDPRLEQYDLSSWQTILYGGSPIAPEILERTRAKLPGIGLYQAYGMTETSPVITILDNESHSGRRLASCGRPAQGVDVSIQDFAGNPVPRGETGEVCTRGPHVMKGYWNRPDDTAQALRGGWMHTGDVAWEDEEGYLYIVDRLKDMIVSGGENVYSAEVEAALYAHPAVREAAVFGIPDEKWGELVTAAVSLKAGQGATADELAQHCRGLLAGYKVPRHIEFIDGELPKSGAGKILKRKLREPFWQGRDRRVSG